jgi:circadian clock protein KaiB
VIAPAEPSPERFWGDAAAPDDVERYDLTLFVSGASDLSARAIANTRQLCDIHLDGWYHLSVVDVHEDPAAVARSQVVATPTLVKNLPLPMRKFVGDLSSTDRVLVALELPVAKDVPGTSR